MGPETSAVPGWIFLDSRPQAGAREGTACRAPTAEKNARGTGALSCDPFIMGRCTKTQGGAGFDPEQYPVLPL